MINQIVSCGGRRWLVRQAVSRLAAMNAIYHAMATGSVGQKDVLDETFIGGSVTVLVDVVQVNSDGSERKPYTEAY